MVFITIHEVLIGSFSVICVGGQINVILCVCVHIRITHLPDHTLFQGEGGGRGRFSSTEILYSVYLSKSGLRKLKLRQETLIGSESRKHYAKSPPSAVAVEYSSLRKPYNGKKSASRSNCE